MAARSGLADGYYWCSHEIDWSKSYPVGWNIVEIAGGRFYVPGVIDDDGLFPSPSNLPDYVRLIGPLQPPTSTAAGCGRRLAPGQHWSFCGETDMGQTDPALCTQCGGKYLRDAAGGAG